MTKEEAVAKLREQGHEVTPEEAKALDALLSTGKMDDADLDKVVGGISPRFKKALIGAGVLVALVGGGYGIRRLRGRKGGSGKIREGESGSKGNPIVLGNEEENLAEGTSSVDVKQET